MGVCAYPTDKGRGGNVQRLSCGIQRRYRVLLRAQRVGLVLEQVFGTHGHTRVASFYLSLTPRHGVIKVCDEFPGFTRFTQHWPYGSSSPQRISVPRSHAKHPSDTIPLVSEQTIGTAIETYLPRFKDKPRFNKALCWCTDTADSNLLVCEYPGWKGFYIASGDSG